MGDADDVDAIKVWSRQSHNLTTRFLAPFGATLVTNTRIKIEFGADLADLTPIWRSADIGVRLREATPLGRVTGTLAPTDRFWRLVAALYNGLAHRCGWGFCCPKKTGSCVQIEGPLTKAGFVISGSASIRKLAGSRGDVMVV